MRKIVTIYSGTQPADGIMSTLAYMDAKTDKLSVVDWQPGLKSSFDMFEEQKPDLIIADSTRIPDLNRALEEYKCQLVVCGGMPPYELKPDLVLLHETVPDMIAKHCPWPYLTLKNAANLGKFRDGSFNEQKSCDILYFASSREPQKSEVDVLSTLAGMKYSFKIIGYKRPLLNYVGRTSVYETADFFASAKITIDIGGSQEYDVAAQQGFCISDRKSSLFPNVDEFSVSNWSEKISSLIEDEGKRSSTSKIAHKKVMNGNTYFHRMSEVFQKLEWTEEAELVKEIFEELTTND